MQTSQDTGSTTPSVMAGPQPAQPAPRGWTVKFLVPPPHTMPTQRLQARAELLRSALSCSSCSNY